MAGLIQKGSDVRKNWRTVNDLARELTAAETELRTLGQLLRGARRAFGSGTPAAPFEVRQRPASDTTWAEDDWLHVSVEGGNVNGTEIPATGIDLPEPEGEEATTHYVWLSAVTSIETDGAVTIESLDINNGATGWDGFPNQPDWDDPPGVDDTQETHLLIAEITIDPATQLLDIRQNVRGDLALWLAGQGCADEVLVRRFRWSHPDQSWP